MIAPPEPSATTRKKRALESPSALFSQLGVSLARDQSCNPLGVAWFRLITPAGVTERVFSACHQSLQAATRISPPAPSGSGRTSETSVWPSASAPSNAAEF